MKTAFTIIVLLITISLKLDAQTPDHVRDSLNSSIETLNLIQELLEHDENSGSRNTELLNELEQLQLHPIPINMATFSELIRIPFLSAYQAEQILNLRDQRTEPFYSVSDLKPILSKQSLDYISGFISFTLPDSLNESSHQKSFWDVFRPNAMDNVGLDVLSRTQLETPSRVGFSNGAYLGSRPKTYNRMQVRYSENVMLSMLVEKDMGERSYADFVTYGVEFNEIYALKTLVFGDYHLRFGQGLAITTDRYFFKSGDVFNSVKQSGSKTRVYASSRENQFFRGAAGQLSLSPLSIFFFYSQTQWDATATDTSFSSLKLDGLHRTASDLEKENQVHETTYGSHIELFFSPNPFRFNIGSTVFHTRYNKPFLPQSSLENQHRFTGRSLSVGSLDWDILVKRTNVFGEWAHNANQNAQSLILGLRHYISKALKTSLVYRDYSPDFFSPYASAFAERGDDARNEKGLFFGLSLKPSRKLYISAYYDVFSFPYISSNTAFPNSGHDLYLSCRYKLNSQYTLQTLIQLKHKEEARVETDQFGDTYKMTGINKTTRLRNDLTYKVSDRYRLKTRLELKWVETDISNNSEADMGWLFYEEMQMTPFETLKLTVRISLFNTDSFDAAIYAYEPNLPLLATTRSFSGSGHRLILNGSYQYSHFASLAFRYAATVRHDVSEIGSGNETAPQNSIQEFSLGAWFKF